MGVPLSCKTRICPSCAKRRAEETAANLVERLPEVSHRHVVVTIPRKAGLRLRVLQDPKLFRKIAQIIVRVLRRQMVRQTSMNRHRKSELEKVDRGGNALLANPAYLRANTVLPPQGGAVTKSSASIRIGISN